MSKSLLPASLQDKNNLALEKCINSALDIDVKKFMKRNPNMTAADFHMVMYNETSGLLK